MVPGEFSTVEGGSSEEEPLDLDKPESVVDAVLGDDIGEGVSGESGDGVETGEPQVTFIELPVIAGVEKYCWTRLNGDSSELVGLRCGPVMEGDE